MEFPNIIWSVFSLLGVDNKVEYELLLSNKRCTTLCLQNEKDDDVLDKSAIKTISNLLSVSIAIYQPDLYFLTMPLLVNAVQNACAAGKNLKISSKPPSAKPPSATEVTGKSSRKRYGDSAVYEIIDSRSLLVELRTEQTE